MKFYLNVEVPVGGHSLAETDMDFWKDLNKTVEGAVGHSDHSGTGFGMRDFQFDRETYEECEFLKARIKKVLMKKYGDDLVKISKFEVREYKED